MIDHDRLGQAGMHKPPPSMFANGLLCLSLDETMIQRAAFAVTVGRFGAPVSSTKIVPHASHASNHVFAASAIIASGRARGICGRPKVIEYSYAICPPPNAWFLHWQSIKNVAHM